MSGGLTIPIFTRPSVNSSRRSTWLYYILLTILFFWIIHSISYRRSVVILRPGDSYAGPRQLDPSQDQTPFAHEPLGLGTLRDVREERFYEGGTLTLTFNRDDTSHPSPAVYDPYPDYNSPEWYNSFAGRFRPCLGPRGRNLDRTNPEDMISAYPGLQKDFPFPLVGSYEVMGLDAWVCTDRYARLGPYGYGDDVTQNIPGFQQPTSVNWDAVNWKLLEQQCLERNDDRFKSNQAAAGQRRSVLAFSSNDPSPPPDNPVRRDPADASVPSRPQPRPRSAILLRAWHTMEWTTNLKQYIRSLIMELSLHTGAEYEVFILVHVKDDKYPVHTNDESVARQIMETFVPPEFRDMVVLFNDKILEAWYPKIQEHSVVHQYWQPAQIFSQLYPDFDYIWQLEIDSRQTGHMYHFLERAEAFARQQPRKYLWERNAYLYIPGAQGDWNQFMRMVETSMEGKKSVWGPRPAQHINPAGPKPPVSTPIYDKYQWGVGEDADLITFLPIFDPADTQWTFPNKLWNIPLETPRRASPVAMGRVSKTLIDLMHNAQREDGMGLASEMTAPSFALWHGLKAVHVPHPIYLDGKWTPTELGRIFNPGAPEKINGGPDSIWNFDHKWDHMLFRMSYMFSGQTGEDFVRRWLGYKIDQSQYIDGSYHQDPKGRNWFDGGILHEEYYGRICFPPMLLHPVKNTDEKKGKDAAVPV